jgi:hypothetical protein
MPNCCSGEYKDNREDQRKRIKECGAEDFDMFVGVGRGMDGKGFESRGVVRLRICRDLAPIEEWLSASLSNGASRPVQRRVIT